MQDNRLCFDKHPLADHSQLNLFLVSLFQDSSKEKGLSISCIADLR